MAEMTPDLLVAAAAAAAEQEMLRSLQIPGPTATPRVESAAGVGDKPAGGTAGEAAGAPGEVDAEGNKADADERKAEDGGDSESDDVVEVAGEVASGVDGEKKESEAEESGEDAEEEEEDESDGSEEESEDESSDDEPEAGGGQSALAPGEAELAKTKNERLPTELPPEEPVSLVLSPEVPLELLGKVTAFIDLLCIVTSSAEHNALDLDSVLWREDRQPLGRVFEVLGPIKQPIYAVRFNSAAAYEEAGVEIGQPIYYASTDQPDVTVYVLTSMLQRLKGTDASWDYDEEPPEEAMEFSDDEQEAEYRRVRRLSARKAHPSKVASSSTTAERPPARRVKREDAHGRSAPLPFGPITPAAAASAAAASSAAATAYAQGGAPPLRPRAPHPAAPGVLASSRHAVPGGIGANSIAPRPVVPPLQAMQQAMMMQQMQHNLQMQAMQMKLASLQGMQGMVRPPPRMRTPWQPPGAAGAPRPPLVRGGAPPCPPSGAMGAAGSTPAPQTAAGRGGAPPWPPHKVSATPAAGPAAGGARGGAPPAPSASQLAAGMERHFGGGAPPPPPAS